MAFIDEGGESVGRYNNLMNQCVTKGRHWGHTVHIIAQEATQIAPLVRSQCTKIFSFAQSRAAGELLAREWLHDELEQCSRLKKREYMYAVKMGGISIHKQEVNHGTLANSGRTGHDGGRNFDGNKTINPEATQGEATDEGEHSTSE